MRSFLIISTINEIPRQNLPSNHLFQNGHAQSNSRRQEMYDHYKAERNIYGKIKK